MKSEREQLFAAVLADPDDDTVRLAYADYLDEQGTKWVTCPDCDDGWRPKRANVIGQYVTQGMMTRCPRCTGTETPGTVPDTSDADLAELIRVGCQTAVWDCTFKCTKEQPGWNHVCGTDDRGYWLCQPFRMREQDILDRHPDWLRDLAMPCPGDGGGATRSAPRCGICGGMGDLLKRENPFLEEHTTGRGIVSRNPTLTRGLTISVECRLGEVVREVDVRCGRCNGVGEVVDYNAYPVPHQRKACPNCQQRKTVRGWQPTPWALAFRDACVGLGRVPAWRVTDREPQPLQGRGCYFQYWAEDLRAKLRVPEPIARKMASLELHSYSEHTSDRHLNLHYPTPAAARHALELAVYRFVQGTPTNT